MFFLYFPLYILDQILFSSSFSFFFFLLYECVCVCVCEKGEESQRSRKWYFPVLFLTSYNYCLLLTFILLSLLFGSRRLVSLPLSFREMNYFEPHR